jgi:hypothetical protein
MMYITDSLCSYQLNRNIPHAVYSHAIIIVILHDTEMVCFLQHLLFEAPRGRGAGGGPPLKIVLPFDWSQKTLKKRYSAMPCFKSMLKNEYVQGGSFSKTCF